MPEVTEIDPTMVRVREEFAKKGWTYQELGIAMGYEGETARKAAFQFIGVKVPRIDTLRKFASAIGVPLADLIGEKNQTSKKVTMQQKKIKELLILMQTPIAGWNSRKQKMKPDELKSSLRLICEPLENYLDLHSHLMRESKVVKSILDPLLRCESMSVKNEKEIAFFIETISNNVDWIIGKIESAIES